MTTKTRDPRDPRSDPLFHARGTVASRRRAVAAFENMVAKENAVPERVADDVVVTRVLQMLPRLDRYEQRKEAFLNLAKNSTLDYAVKGADFEDLLTYEQAVQLTHAPREYVAQEPTLARLYDTLMALRERCMTNLLDDEPWRHNSTSAMQNVVNLATASAYRLVLKDLGYAMATFRETMRNTLHELVPSDDGRTVCRYCERSFSDRVHLS